MFREMRRCRQQLSREESEEILTAASSGVLALAGDDGYPYALPISFLYENGKLYFHCAREGKKLDSIRKCSNASFCVISEDNVCPEKYTTLYRSVIAFGKIRILEKDDEIYEAVEKLAVKYAPEDAPEHRNQFIRQDIDRVCVLEMTVEHMTGKEGLELSKARKK